jgi:hypothetical protein
VSCEAQRAKRDGIPNANECSVRLRNKKKGQAMIEYLIIAGALMVAVFGFRYFEIMGVMRNRASSRSNLLHQPLP